MARPLDLDDVTEKGKSALLTTYRGGLVSILAAVVYMQVDAHGDADTIIRQQQDLIAKMQVIEYKLESMQSRIVAVETRSQQQQEEYQRQLEDIRKQIYTLR